MSNSHMLAIDGNEACVSVAYRLSEIAVIYPITPSSTMGELADQWASEKRPNIWGSIPEITEMQSEGGAAGACHGVTQAGALGTTFTSAQGLLLMIPNMYRIAGELTPFVIHVAARALATHCVSMYGDHDDVMACRNTGFAMLASASVQEAHDMAAIAHASTIRSRVPFLHFFDGFRTSHEVSKIIELSNEELRQLFTDDLIAAHRQRALSPDHPFARGTAQVPEAYFQSTEARNPYHAATPAIVQDVMDKFAAVTGRPYHLVDYVGDPQAETVIVIMGSGSETATATSQWLNQHGERTGVLTVRLFRPFPLDAFIAALPPSVKNIAVLDRAKDPNALGEPLYCDVCTALLEARAKGMRPAAAEPRVIGGRYGLSSKEFTPAMVKAVFDEARSASPKQHFTVGIIDDVTHLSLSVGPALDIDPPGTRRAVFFGLGADGTVGANKNSIKVVADGTDLWAQGYFVFDSKKSGGYTISHLRFSPERIHAPYLIDQAHFVACHQFNILDRLDVLGCLAPGGTVLLNAPYPKDEVWGRLSRPVQQAIIDKKAKLFAIDAAQVAEAAGLGRRINTVMQTCFFALSSVMETSAALDYIKKAIAKTYKKKGQAVIEKNWAVVDMSLAKMFEIKVPARVTTDREMPPVVPDDAPQFVKTVTAALLAGKGDELPVSLFPIDGTWPAGTTCYEKRNISDQIPVWEPAACIQCNKCVMVCPHTAIRAKAVQEPALAGAPASLKTLPYKGPEVKGGRYILQVAPEDCTGCTLCVNVCPGKSKADPSHAALVMQAKEPVLEQEKANFKYFLDLPELDPADIKITVKTAELLKPLIEFSGACTGCGETPYVKAMTQLFGDRLLIANAAGCSSVWGGNLPTIPYTTNKEGRGPAWSSSLFEDNAEFGLGFRLAIDHLKGQAQALVKELAGNTIPDALAQAILYEAQADAAGIKRQRQNVVELRRRLEGLATPAATKLGLIADYLVDKVVWSVGGDGWAYDIGYGGLDHVLASGRNVNLLVLDTQVYSNTGGQQSKATPIGAAVKFAAAGKQRQKKDLGMMAMTYGDVYVASVAVGAKDGQALKAIEEAASYKGVSLVLAYSHCITHGYDLSHGLEHQKAAVESGFWPLYRFDPRRMGNGQSPLEIDAEPTKSIRDFMEEENRFRITERIDQARYDNLVEAAAEGIQRRQESLQRIAEAGKLELTGK